jgi:hypothetical protein
VVYATTFEGWSLLPPRAGRKSAFEVWSGGDRMRTMTVQSVAGGGANWLGLTNGVANGGLIIDYQTLGISRTIDTIDGSIYTFSFNYAGALGVTQENAQIAVYLDSQRIAVLSRASGNTALDWQVANLQFTGNGRPQTLTLQLENANATAVNGIMPLRSVMLDNLRLVETLPQGTSTIYGLADTAIFLPTVDARLTDTHGSERLKIELLALPIGTVVSDGASTFTITSNTSALDVTKWNFATLTLKPPSGFAGALELQVRAISIEASNGASTSVTQSLTVNVLEGKAVTTPPGVNPYVSYTRPTLTLTSTAGEESLAAVTPLTMTSLLSERGSLSFTAVPKRGLRSFDEEEQVDELQADILTDAWLHELEQAAQLQWGALMAPAALS